MQKATCIDLLRECPTPWHFESYVQRILSNKIPVASFHDIDKISGEQKYALSHGGMVYGVILPRKRVEKLAIYACHTDSPCLKVKPQGLYKNEEMTLLNCEIYGAPILASWIGRPLQITGKVWGEDSNGKFSEWLLPAYNSIPAIIPHVAIHLDRNVNDSFQIQKQEMLSCIISNKGDISSFEDLVRPFIPDIHKVHFHDLFVIPAEIPSFQERVELISPRLDNLSSAWALLRAFQDAEISDTTAQLFLFCNHEEIGSETTEGAYSSLVHDLVNVILEGLSEKERLAIKAKSTIVSCDAAHATHPILSEKHDSRHKVYLGKGIALKLNSNYKYSSPPEKVAQVLALFKKEHIPYQIFTSRNDIPCGSTVGPILSTRLGINAIDIGAPILGMHAALEMGTISDIEALKLAIQKLYFL